MDFSQALSETESSTTAGCIEALLPGIAELFWLLANSNALIQASDARVLNMILERALPNGVSMALEVSWNLSAGGCQPQLRRPQRCCADSAPWPRPPN